MLFDALSLTSLAILLDQSKETIALLLGRLYLLVDILEEEDRLIQLLYPSFCEFLLDLQRYSNTTFYIDAKEVYQYLFEYCLAVISSFLYNDIYNLRQLGIRVGNVLRSDVNKNVPFTIQYICRYQVYYLEQSDIDPLRVLQYRRVFFCSLPLVARDSRLNGLAS